MDLRILHVTGESWVEDARTLLDRDVDGTPVRTDVVRTSSVRDACLQLRTVPFDVVLLDLSAQERGPGSVLRIREVDAEVPVVVWGCGPDRFHRLAWWRAGATDLLDGDCHDVGRLLGALLRAARQAWTHGGDVVARARHERHF